jgi:hypothetical protein
MKKLLTQIVGDTIFFGSGIRWVGEREMSTSQKMQMRKGGNEDIRTAKLCDSIDNYRIHTHTRTEHI